MNLAPYDWKTKFMFNAKGGNCYRIAMMIPLFAFKS